MFHRKKKKINLEIKNIKKKKEMKNSTESQSGNNLAEKDKKNRWLRDVLGLKK